MLVEKLPVFMQSSDLEVQERVRPCTYGSQLDIIE